MKTISKILVSLGLSVFMLSCGSSEKNEASNKSTEEASASKDVQADIQKGPIRNDIQIDPAMIMEAALNNDFATVEKALKDGYDVNATDADMHTALMMAAYNGHSQLISLLLDHGAKPDLRDIQDRTALMYASTGPFNETVSLLIMAGATLNLVDNVEHFTALMFAAAEGQAEVVSNLLKHGADKSLVDIDGESAYDFALANGHQNVVLLLK